MITYYSDTFNQNFSKMQTFYNECLEDLNIASLECSCHHKGHLIKHGFYTVDLHNNLKEKFKII